MDFNFSGGQDGFVEFVKNLFHELKDKIAYIAVGFAVTIWGKNWRKKLTEWVKNKLISLVLSLGKNWNKSWIVSFYNRNFRTLRTEIIKRAFSEIHFYQVDQIRIYVFIKGEDPVYSEFYGFSAIKLFIEVNIEETFINVGFPIKMSSLAYFFNELEQKGFIHIPCIDEATEDQRYITDIMRAENVKSSYMELFFDSNGKPAIVAIMNSKGECVRISDFARFRGTLREIACEIGQIKPRK